MSRIIVYMLIIFYQMAHVMSVLSVHTCTTDDYWLGKHNLIVYTEDVVASLHSRVYIVQASYDSNNNAMADLTIYLKALIE